MSTNNNNIDDLIEELRNDPVAALPKNEQPKIQLTAETIEEFVLDKASRLISNGLASVEELKEIIQQGVNPEEVLAYSDLIKATTGAIETVNKINLQNKKAKTQIQLKDMDVELRKNLPAPQTNILIATREEIIKQLAQQATSEIAREPVRVSLVDEPDKVIDIEPAD